MLDLNYFPKTIIEIIDLSLQYIFRCFYIVFEAKSTDVPATPNQKDYLRCILMPSLTKTKSTDVPRPQINPPKIKSKKVIYSVSHKKTKRWVFFMRHPVYFAVLLKPKAQMYPRPQIKPKDILTSRVA